MIGRIPILRSSTAAGKVLEIWDKYRRLYNVKMLDYVIKHNYIHIVVWSEQSRQTEWFLEQTLQRVSGMLLELTVKAADHFFSSASWYIDGSGPLEIDEIEW